MDKWADYKHRFCGCKAASRYNSCKGLANCELLSNHPERISPQAEKIRNVVAAQTRSLNELVCQAIARVTGATDVNPYDYLNRMSKMENAAGMTVYLDGSAILWVGPGQLRTSGRVSPAADYSQAFDLPYRFLGDSKNPAEAGFL